MGRRCGRCVMGSARRYVFEPHQIGSMGAINGVDRVVHGGMHHGEAACWMDGCRLGTRRAYDRQECLVPLYNWIILYRRRPGPVGKTYVERQNSARGRERRGE